MLTLKGSTPKEVIENLPGPFHLDEHLTDTVLVVPPEDTRPFRLRDAYNEVLRLKRPLTDEEMEKYRY